MDNYENSDKFEIADVENYQSNKMNVFNHQGLIMEILRKVNEAGSHEMRTGYTNTKVDHAGNITRIYIEDTRKKFIETVKQAISNMTCDFDKEAKEKIGKIKKKIEDLKKDLLEEQWKWWNSLTPKYQMIFATNGRSVGSRNAFNINLEWWQRYVDDETDYYREVVGELHKLTKRLDFYQSEDFEA